MRTPFIDLPKMQITTQSGVMVEEDDLVKLNLEQQKALDWLLRDVGAEQLLKHIELERIRPRRQQQRRATRKALDDEVRNAAGRVLKAKKLKPKGRDYFRKSAGKDNFVYVKFKRQGSISGECSVNEQSGLPRKSSSFVRLFPELCNK
jgi:hypothetical protein